MIRVLAITLAVLLLSAPAFARVAEEIQAPRTDEEIQAPRTDEEVQAPRIEIESV